MVATGKAAQHRRQVSASIVIRYAQAYAAFEDQPLPLHGTSNERTTGPVADGGGWSPAGHHRCLCAGGRPAPSDDCLVSLRLWCAVTFSVERCCGQTERLAAAWKKSGRRLCHRLPDAPQLDHVLRRHPADLDCGGHRGVSCSAVLGPPLQRHLPPQTGLQKPVDCHAGGPVWAGTHH